MAFSKSEGGGILTCAGTLLHKIALAKRGSMSVPTLADVDGDDVVEKIIKYGVPKIPGNR